jgi:polyisoprenoid-binding protein YceI
MKTLLIALSLFLVCTTQAQTLDVANAEISINMGTEVKNGSMGDVKADVKFDADGNITSIIASAAVSTVDTGEPSRDPEVKSDFLKGGNHPRIEFKSTGIVATESGWLATGNLSMAGKTMEIKMPIVKADGKYIARMKFSTKDFDVYDTDAETVVHITIPEK